MARWWLCTGVETSCQVKTCIIQFDGVIDELMKYMLAINLLKPNGYLMHQQF
jgi:hypothetical protein